MIDENMFSPLGILFLIIFVTESIVCLLGNGFIIVVNGYSWLRSRKMLPCDFLLTTLCLSRFLCQCVSTSSQFVFLSSPEIYIGSKKEEGFCLAWMYSNIASLFCVTWLNVFYCVKVINFAYPFLVWLKLRIGVLVPRCLGISLLAFIICSIPPLIIRSLEVDKHRNLTGETSQNLCGHGLLFLQMAFAAISFSICVSMSGLLLLSLWRHRRNLKKSGLSTKDLSTQAHLGVMLPLLLLLAFYILRFAATVIAFTDILRFGKLERLVSDIALYFYPTAHSVILIFTNPKLRKACIHVINFRGSAS